MTAKAKRRNGKPGKSSASCVSKSISLPTDLIKVVDQRYSAQPEWDWSKHVRGLVRRDLESAETKKSD